MKEIELVKFKQKKSTHKEKSSPRWLCWRILSNTFRTINVKSTQCLFRKWRREHFSTHSEASIRQIRKHGMRLTRKANWRPVSVRAQMHTLREIESAQVQLQ